MVAFTARRGKTEFVVPSRPTPEETKNLSDMDDQPAHWIYIPILEFFQRRDTNSSHTSPEDPAMAIKAALADVLVLYYPIAGRLRETTGGKLVVDCTGEGVAFVEADAAARLEDLGTPPVPPYPCLEELLPDAGDFQVVVGKPIAFVQVTRFQCGGFVIGVQFNHSVADAYGMIQFLKAIADVARGEAAPEVLPVWGREQLTARSPPSPAYVQEKLLTLLMDPARATPPASMASRYFFFGPTEVSALRSRLPEDHRLSCTRFELLTAAIWRCRTSAWAHHAAGTGKRTRLTFLENARRRWQHSIPRGYYGNAVVYHVVDVAVEELCGRPLDHAVKLIREAKKDATEEHLRSTVDFLASVRGQMMANAADGKPKAVYDDEAYIVSDWTRLGEDALDLGWAERVGGGTAMPLSLVSFHGTCQNSNAEESVVVSVLLPQRVMERFEKEIEVLVNN